jgi:hypothetical protein
MSASAVNTGIYSGSKFSFRDIVSEDKLGGINGLKSYLLTRISQLSRKLKSVGNDVDEKARILLAITAMGDAIKIVEEMSANTKKKS